MADVRIAAIFRSRDYSPNHIGNDAAILNEVCDQLRKRGCCVITFCEDQLINMTETEKKEFNAWLTMSRSPRCVSVLQEMEKNGAIIINSAFGIENCRRGRMCRILTGHNVPIAENFITNTDASVQKRLTEEGYRKCWIKQADAHSMHKEDVTFVRHPEEAQEVLQEYFMRGIKEAVICKHITGDLIRFYGIRGTNFFKWFLPMDDRHFSPDTNEEETANTYKIDENKLRRLCDYASELLELQVYGGDCILLPSGELKLIDVNDWPSFAPCRKAAASIIAKLVLKKAK